MKAIIRYKADDGTEFASQEKCELYERFCDGLEFIMKSLPRPDIQDEKCWQHPKGSVKAARDRAIAYIGEYLGIPDHMVIGAINANHNQTIFGRFISDGGNRAANGVWGRFMSMSVLTDREYSQPYYLLKAEGVQK